MPGFLSKLPVCTDSFLLSHRMLGLFSSEKKLKYTHIFEPLHHYIKKMFYEATCFIHISLTGFRQEVPYFPLCDMNLSYFVQNGQEIFVYISKVIKNQSSKKVFVVALHNQEDILREIFTQTIFIVPWSFNYPLQVNMGFSSGSTSRSLVDLIAGLLVK